MNKVILIGNLTKDPEIRTTSTGKKVASFSLAVNDGKDSNGQELVQYFNCTAWDKTAEIIESYIKKGYKVGIGGKLKNRSWDKPDGTKGYATDITVNDLEILTSRIEGERLAQNAGESGGASSSSAPARKPASRPAQADEDLDNGGELPEIDVDSINVQMPF